MRIFVTGASGWIGRALVPDLIEAGHQVVGLARSEASAATLTAAGAEAIRGTVDDLDVLAGAAAASDGVIHLAFKHDIAFSGSFQEAAEADRRAVDALAEPLVGTDRPFVLASGLAGLKPGRVATEQDMPTVEDGSAFSIRAATSLAVLDYASRGVRSSVVRLSPTCHGDGD
jgi:nucleoside-diphosphate-sugar epimerase